GSLRLGVSAAKSNDELICMAKSPGHWAVGADQALQPSARIGGLALAPRRLCEVVHISLGLSWQVGFTRLAAVNSARPGQARVAVPSRSSSHQANKTWMPGSADKFMQSAQAWLRAGYDCGLQSLPMLRG